METYFRVLMFRSRSIKTITLIFFSNGAERALAISRSASSRSRGNKIGFLVKWSPLAFDDLIARGMKPRDLSYLSRNRHSRCLMKYWISDTVVIGLTTKSIGASCREPKACMRKGRLEGRDKERERKIEERYGMSVVPIHYKLSKWQ